MSSTSASAPALTPSFCFSQSALQDFLRQSRHFTDDTISQNLNALLPPVPFDPSSTSVRQDAPRVRRQVPAESCDRFKKDVLFPAWQTRSDVLNYCAGVATSPDPNDPDHVLREVEDARARERVIDERLDPYSGRYFPREVRTESLAGLIRNERMVEGIVRDRTWQVMNERCTSTGAVKGHGFDDALEQWRKTSRTL